MREGAECYDYLLCFRLTLEWHYLHLEYMFIERKKKAEKGLRLQRSKTALGLLGLWSTGNTMFHNKILRVTTRW